MSRRLALVIVAVLGVAATLFVFARGESPPPDERETTSPPAAKRPRESRPPADAPPPLPAAVPGTIAGQVLRAGAPVEGAVITLRTEDADVETRSSTDGAFVFEGVTPGRVLLAAFTEREASEVVGPFVLAPGQRVEGVMLTLHAAAFVSGAVYDVRSGHPIAGATVRSSSGEVVTGSDGRFRLGPLPATGTWLQARATGYETRLQWLTVDGARDRAGMDFYLRAAVAVRGRVVRQGDPVTGAAVWAETATLTSQPDRFGPAITGADGAFELGVAPGQIQFIAAAPGGGRVPGPTRLIAEGGVYDDVEIELGQPLTAEGIVSVDGVPEGGVQITIFDARTERIVGAAVTDADGAFALGGLAPGRYLVQLTRSTLVAQRGPFELTGDADAPWLIDVSGVRRVFGRVEPPTAGVLVRLRATQWAGGRGPETTTDAEGRFAFDAAPEGDWSVEAESDVAWGSVRGEAGRELVVRLERASLRGVARDARGHPVTDFVVHANSASGAPARVRAVLDPNGAFTVPVPPGRYEVFARSPSHGDSDVVAVEVAAGRDASVELRLGGRVRVRARVVDHVTRAPLNGVEVASVRWNPRAGMMARTMSAVLTDAEGRFELSTGAESGALRLRKDGYRTIHVRLPPAAETGSGAELEYAMTPGPSETRGPVEPYEGVGMQLRPDPSGAVFIESVFDGSPAQLAGVLRGDQLLAVDGASVSGVPLDQVIRRIMGPAGSVVRLRFRRGDHELDLAVRRRSIQL